MPVGVVENSLLLLAFSYLSSKVSRQNSKGLNIPEEFPDELRIAILQKYLSSQPLHDVYQFVYESKSSGLQKSLETPAFKGEYAAHESWILKPKCKRREDLSLMEVYDPQQKKQQLIPILHFPLPGRDSPIVYSSQSGDCGLVFLKSSSDWYVVNPMIKSCRKLPLYRARGSNASETPGTTLPVDRFSAGYVGWTSDQHERMYPVLLNLQTQVWEPVGNTRFHTNGRIKMKKAVVDEICFIRYESPEFKHQIIKYDIGRGTFSEVTTKGLPDSMDYTYDELFEYRGHVYLPTVQRSSHNRLGQTTVRHIVLWELNTSDPMALEWRKTTSLPCLILKKVIKAYPSIVKLTFLHIGNELLVASKSFRRARNGAGISCIDEGTTGIAVYDFVSCSWRNDGYSSWPGLDSDVSIFRPRLNVEA